MGVVCDAMSDNVECFGDCIYILSLGAGITMLMTENSDPARTGGRDIEDSRLAGNGARDPPPPSTSPGTLHKQTHFPLCSLIFLASLRAKGN